MSKGIRIMIRILFGLSIIAALILAYNIGFGVGIQKAHYTFVITLDPNPDDIEPKPSKDKI